MVTSQSSGSSGADPTETKISQNTKVLKYIQDILSSPAVGDIGGDALKALSQKQAAITNENLVLKAMTALQTPVSAPNLSGTPQGNQ